VDCGLFRSRDAGDSWQEITSGLPSDFGFSLAIHPREPRTLYVLPLQEADFRCPLRANCASIGAATLRNPGRLCRKGCSKSTRLSACIVRG
jgi:hypothetical protein